MVSSFSVSLDKVIKEFTLETLNMPRESEDIYISSPEINRPGLHLDGFFECFDETRIQIFGMSEHSYLMAFSDDERKKKIDEFFIKKPIAVIIARNLEVPEMTVSAREHDIPLLRTEDSTSIFLSALIAFLNIQLAPRITRHGVLVEVYGEGLLMLGESGVGKSETAIELIKRGHRLIADDAVEIRRVSAKTLVGSAPENIRHFIELRGIGIINARRIFGMGAVKLTEKIDMIINLEQWNSDKVYDRMGLENETTSILGLSVTSLTIPVKPGRNLAVIIEVAAMNNRQKKMGFNAANELLEKLGMAESFGQEKTNVDWDL